MLENPTVLRAIASRINRENVGVTLDEQAGKKTALETVAGSFGLLPEEVDKAIRTWQVSSDAYEKGLKSFYLNLYPEAVNSLSDAYGKRKTDLLDVLLPLASSLYMVGRYRDAVDKYKEAISLSGEEPDLLTALAAALEQSGDFEAAKNAAGRALEMARTKYSKFHPRFTDSLFALGSLYVNHGQPEEGMALFDEAIKVLEFDVDPGDLRPMHYLTDLAVIQMGENKQKLAEESLGRAVAFGEKRSAPPEEMGFTQATYAGLLTSEGHLKQAEAILRLWFNKVSSLRLTGEYARKRRNSTLQLLVGYLIDVYLIQGQFNEHTGELIKQALSNSRLMYGPSFAVTLLLRQKAVWETNRYDYSNAEETYNELLEILERVKGKDHVAVTSARLEIADVYLREKKVTEAEKIAVETVTRIRNAGRPLTATDMNCFVQLERIYSIENRPRDEAATRAEAEAMTVGDLNLRAALNLFEAIVSLNRDELTTAIGRMGAVLQLAPESSPQYYDALRFMGIVESKLGHEGAVSSYFGKAMKFAERDPNQADKFVRQVLIEWALALSNLPTNEEEPLRRLLDKLIRQKEDDRGVALIWILIAKQQQRRKLMSAAETSFKKGCDEFEKADNSSRQDLASCLSELGAFQLALSHYKDAETNLSKALEVMETAYDQNSPALIGYLTLLMELDNKLNRQRNVEEILARLKRIKEACPYCGPVTVSY